MGVIDWALSKFRFKKDPKTVAKRILSSSNAESDIITLGKFRPGYTQKDQIEVLKFDKQAQKVSRKEIELVGSRLDDARCNEISKLAEALERDTRTAKDLISNVVSDIDYHLKEVFPVARKLLKDPSGREYNNEESMAMLVKLVKILETKFVDMRGFLRYPHWYDRLINRLYRLRIDVEKNNIHETIEHFKRLRNIPSTWTRIFECLEKGLKVLYLNHCAVHKAFNSVRKGKAVIFNFKKNLNKVGNLLGVKA